MSSASGADVPRGGDLASRWQGPALAGGLVLGGLLISFVARLFHPSGDEDDHEAIFTEYADNGAWVAVHLVEFVGVATALAGLLVLYRVLRVSGEAPVLAGFAAGATIAAAACWAVLQGLDGVALKQAVDAWVGASGAQEEIRFDNAETVRWLEWGFQTYFRVLLGLSLALFGAAILVTRLIKRWLGWVAVLAGALSAALGIVVAYEGLESGFDAAAGPAFLVVMLVFAIGLLVTGLRRRQPLAATQA